MSSLLNFIFIYIHIRRVNVGAYDGSSSRSELTKSKDNKSKKGSIISESISSNTSIDNVTRMIEDEVMDKLRSIIKTKSLHGYPINLPYFDKEVLLNTIRSLCVHENKHPEVQFVLALKVFPYVNGLMSVWIYIGTLEN